MRSPRLRDSTSIGLTSSYLPVHVVQLSYRTEHRTLASFLLCVVSPDWSQTPSLTQELETGLEAQAVRKLPADVSFWYDESAVSGEP